MNEVYNNFGQQTIAITYSDALAQVSQQITSQLLLIGLIVVGCALWRMFVNPRLEIWYVTASNAIDMLLFVAGAYLIGLYAVAYWGWQPW